MAVEHRTEDLFLAAFLRAVGATVVRYEDGDHGQGVVVLDTTDVTQARVAAEADKFARQLRGMPACPKMSDAEFALENTLLGAIADQFGKMRKTILTRRQR